MPYSTFIAGVQPLKKYEQLQSDFEWSRVEWSLNLKCSAVCEIKEDFKLCDKWGNWVFLLSGISFCKTVLQFTSSCVTSEYEPSSNCHWKDCRVTAEIADLQISHVNVLLHLSYCITAGITGWQHSFSKATYLRLHYRSQLWFIVPEGILEMV